MLRQSPVLRGTTLTRHLATCLCSAHLSLSFLSPLRLIRPASACHSTNATSLLLPNFLVRAIRPRSALTLDCCLLACWDDSELYHGASSPDTLRHLFAPHTYLCNQYLDLFWPCFHYIMASVNTTTYDLPPLPEYTLTPLTALSTWASDAFIQAALPVVGYWAVSLIFHAIDVYDLFPQYRLHTPAEVLKRNHVSRYEVLRDVVLQQIIQIIASFSLSIFDEAPTTGKADYDVAWYAQKIRIAQRAVPHVLSLVGVNPVALASQMSESRPMLSSVLIGGKYPGLLQSATTITGEQNLVPAFASWELAVASFAYWYAIPAIQFSAAIVVMDAWEYMLHRAMHMNKWLYGKSHAPDLSIDCTADTRSNLPLTSPPSLCSICLRSTLQPPY